MTHLMCKRVSSLGFVVAFVGCLIAGSPVWGQAPANIQPDSVKKVKKATVYFKVEMADGTSAEGSGFFAMERGIVLTNAHVVGMLSRRQQAAKKIDVVGNSGQKDEYKMTGIVLGVDRDNDLAVMRVEGEDKALARSRSPVEFDMSDLVELQKVYIFGFPLGAELGKEITASESSISAFRKDPTGSSTRFRSMAACIPATRAVRSSMPGRGRGRGRGRHSRHSDQLRRAGRKGPGARSWPSAGNTDRAAVPRSEADQAAREGGLPRSAPSHPRVASGSLDGPGRQAAPGVAQGPGRAARRHQEANHQRQVPGGQCESGHLDRDGIAAGARLLAATGVREQVRRQAMGGHEHLQTVRCPPLDRVDANLTANVAPSERSLKIMSRAVMQMSKGKEKFSEADVMNLEVLEILENHPKGANVKLVWGKGQFSEEFNGKRLPRRPAAFNSIKSYVHGFACNDTGALHHVRLPQVQLPRSRDGRGCQRHGSFLHQQLSVRVAAAAQSRSQAARILAREDSHLDGP